MFFREKIDLFLEYVFTYSKKEKKSETYTVWLAFWFQIICLKLFKANHLDIYIYIICVCVF